MPSIDRKFSQWLSLKSVKIKKAKTEQKIILAFGIINIVNKKFCKTPAKARTKLLISLFNSILL